MKRIRQIRGAFSPRSRGSSQTGSFTKAGLEAWYDTTSDTYLTLSGSAITQFLDRSGNGNDSLVQSTSTKRPTRIANQINGLQAAVFDGGDQIDLPSVLHNIPASDFTIFAVVKQNPTDTADRIIVWTDGGSSRTNLSYSTSGGALFYSNAVFDEVSKDTDTITFDVITARRSGTTQAISVNGLAEQTDTAAADVTGADGLSIGASFVGSEPLNGVVVAVLIYNRSLTVAERAQVQLSLADTYSTYNLSANWILSYTPDQQSLIHASFLNKDDAFQDTEGNPYKVWLDSSDLSTITKDGSDKVSQWNDKSGNSNNVIQPTGSRQPTWVESAINAKAAMSFDGTTIYFWSSDIQNFLKPGDDFTFTAVITLGINDANRKVLYGSSVDTSNRSTISINVDNEIVSAVYDGSYSIKAATLTDTNNPHLVTFTNAGTVVNQYLDGVLSTDTSGSPSTGSGDIFRLGSRTDVTEFWNGYMAEIIIYDKVVSVFEQQQVRAYLSNKWGVSLP